MSVINSQRSSCKDVFNSFLVKNAEYAGMHELPTIQPSNQIPKKLISFSKAISSTDYHQWVHFYEDDWLFERVWRNPQKYISILSKFEGVILPDFSLYRDMPMAMQIWNIYRSRAIGNWLQENQISVIPNIRFGDNRTAYCACDGIPKESVIAIGSHGTIKNREDRKYFAEGVDIVVNTINPRVIIVYGSAPASIFETYENRGIKIIQFDSNFAQKHKDGV